MTKKETCEKKWRLLACAVALFICAGVSAQTAVVTGRVLDGGHEPLIGANVTEKGTANMAVTNAEGDFSITVSSPGAVLLVKYIGYKDTEAAASPGMEIVMEEESGMLDDVVVIGYGVVKKADATGSVTAFKPDEFNKGLRTTAQDALVGKIAGVNVVSSSGAPGSGSTIRIRSGASLSASNDPLIVIDGVPVDNSTIEGGSNVNIIGAINPNDIETFTVLKDASATAIYGSRASNGVIIITTKKGTDDKVKLNYSGNFSVSTTTKRLETLTGDEFREYVPTVTGVPSGISLGTENTDWQDEIYRAAFGHEHNVSATGKLLHNAPYRVSLGYTNQNGIVKTNNYERFTFSGGIAPKFFDDHLTVDLNLKVSYENNRKVADSVTENAVTYDPTRPVTTGDTSSSTQPGLGYFIWMNGESPMAIQTDNPVAQLELMNLRNRITRSIGNAAISYKVHHLEDLQLNLNLGYDVLRSKYTERVPDLAGMMYTANMKDGTGLDYSSKQNKRNYLLDAYANYSHIWDKRHSFSAMAGYGWQHFWKKYVDTTLSPEGEELFSSTHTESEYYLISFYGRLNYSYDERYMITATLRSDASSRFSKSNRWGVFPSVALAWRISQEEFLKDSSVLSDLKLRLSYGQTGQQDIINDYPYMATFSVSYPEARYQFGDTWYYTYRPNGYDSDIKWETTTTYNVGVDYGFLDNRIYGSIDYYYRKTKDLLNTINVISGTNYSSVLTTNIGEMNNKGLEFAINAVPIVNKDWKWTIGFNYTWNDSKITKLNVIDSDTNFVQTGSISDTGKTVQVFMVGQRPYTFYLAKQAYDSDGKPIEGQYIQEDGSVSSTETKYATGKSALPTSYLGINTQLSYKNWDLAISGHGSFGAYVYNYVAANDYVQTVYSDQGNFSNILARTWATGFQQQQLYSDYFLEKGNFFRIDNITLGYTFPRLWDNYSSLRLTFGVQNVATITGYSGVDPEIYSGIDREVYPRPRVFSLGVNLNF
ncbi:MAG: TonB-dependent receptor [Prevotella sp.]|nr:TonB-dependent receptor [Prevotella sp.]